MELEGKNRRTYGCCVQVHLRQEVRKLESLRSYRGTQILRAGSGRARLVRRTLYIDKGCENLTGI